MSQVLEQGRGRWKGDRSRRGQRAGQEDEAETGGEEEAAAKAAFPVHYQLPELTQIHVH